MVQYDSYPEILRRLYETLKTAYPCQPNWPDGDWPRSGHFQPCDFEIIVGAILVQNTRWENTEVALERMVKSGLCTPRRVYDSPIQELESAIRPAGFFRQKAKTLKRAVEYLCRFPGDFPRLPEREELLAIKGIGPETADSILLYGFDKLEFVVDAYTRRFLRRFGIFHGDDEQDRIKSIMTRVLPAEPAVYKELHALIVHHCRDQCTKEPVCRDCSLQDACTFASRRPG